MLVTARKEFIKLKFYSEVAERKLAFLFVVMPAHWGDVVQLTVTTKAVRTNVIVLLLLTIRDGVAVGITMPTKPLKDDRLFLIT